jgi:hypothetical protein
VIKAGAARVDHLLSAPLNCRLPAILSYIRLGCKSLPGTNSLAYFASTPVTKKKSFVIFPPGANVIKLFLFIIYELL